MSPEAQRVAIAEACGFSCLPNHGLAGGFLLRFPDGHLGTELHSNFYWAVINEGPEYVTDLNAIHTAERTLTNDQRRQYILFLIEVHPLRYDPFADVSEDGDGYMKVFFLANATAPQRAEAFLRTLGKWSPSPTQGGSR